MASTSPAQRKTYSAHDINHMHTFIHNLKRTVALVLLAGFILPALSMSIAPPRQAEAFDISTAACAVASLLGVIGPAAGTAVAVAGGFASALLAVPVNETNTSVVANLANISAQTTITAGADASLTTKECIIDPLLWLLKNVIITMLTEQILAWIQGGFEGAPVFLTDPTDFFREVGFTALNQLLFESGIAEFICSPFRADLQLAVFYDYNFPKYAEGGSSSCRHDEIFAGSGGSFEILVEEGNLADSGGLPALLGMFDDRNNPLGSYYALQSEAAARVGGAMAAESQLLGFGDGFFSMRCDTDGDGNNDGACTPGQYVVDQIEDWSGGMLAQLEVADEVSEIVTALLAALVHEILSDTEQGLLGVGNGGTTFSWEEAIAAQEAEFEEITIPDTGETGDGTTGGTTDFWATISGSGLTSETCEEWLTREGWSYSGVSVVVNGVRTTNSCVYVSEEDGSCTTSSSSASPSVLSNGQTYPAASCGAYSTQISVTTTSGGTTGGGTTGGGTTGGGTTGGGTTGAWPLQVPTPLPPPPPIQA